MRSLNVFQIMQPYENQESVMRRSGSSQTPPTPKKCSLFSHLKCCLRQSFCLFRTLISKVDMGEKVKIFLHFLHVLSCARCNMLRGGRRSWTHKPAGCFKTSPAISAQAVHYSTQRTNKSPRFLPLQQPIPFGQFAVFIFCFVCGLAHLYCFGREAV